MVVDSAVFYFDSAPGARTLKPLPDLLNGSHKMMEPVSLEPVLLERQ